MYIVIATVDMIMAIIRIAAKINIAIIATIDMMTVNIDIMTVVIAER